MASSSPKYKLIDFNSRVLGEPIRLLFAALQVDYTFDRITDVNWAELKSSTPWGSLPVLEDNNGKILAQSGSILRYLGAKYNMVGADAFEEAKCDELIGVMGDLRKEYFTAFLQSDPAKKKQLEDELLAKTFPFHLQRLNELIESNGSGYLVGTKLSIGDLSVASALQLYNLGYPGLLDPYPALNKHQDTIFNSNSGIKDWIAKRTSKDPHK